MPVKTLKIGSRESPLALVQTHHAMALLQQRWPDLTLELKTYKTKGDLILDTSLSQVGDKGLFVKELEMALLSEEIDLAIHSMKDMPSEQPEGLGLSSFGEREDPRDVLITPNGEGFNALKSGSRIGTSSLRRIAQFQTLRPDLVYETIRGNLNTRLRKMEEGQYQGIILAAAGVHRLGWESRISQYFDPIFQSIPAVGQGILGVEYRLGDCSVQDTLEPLEHSIVQTACVAERSFLKTLQGGCQVPLAAYCRLKENNNPSAGYVITGAVFSLDGQTRYTDSTEFSALSQARASGQTLAESLISQGANDILASLKTSH
jgi:hydroxymethylbilane synthase